MKKVYLTILLFFGMVTLVFTQQKKIEEKANDKVKELNDLIVSVDTTLALTNEQRQKIYQLQIDKIREYKIVMDHGGDKASGKVVFKKYYKKVEAVLTPEQKKAKMKAKKQLQANENNAKKSPLNKSDGQVIRKETKVPLTRKQKREQIRAIKKAHKKARKEAKEKEGNN
ncbi:hypothetical protein UMM65_16200 [Aureibaculum sp. 2210JD6-5]|uniref:hypothetical protein n=1 Tax=Aureibaculum sp. 2210JD6-5 TaxID=3103957 RepID=UPI002AAC8856|nr:hypothetical protein [Aureibaculum sp. 2210JD6-5]MDY7396791.1 hypothetical protein [Aureibaculum sp. 2210JD6-5]